MSLKPYIEPRKRISHAARMRNRAIAIFVFVLLCVGIGSCLSKDKDPGERDELAKTQAQAMEEEEREDTSTVSTVATANDVNQNISQAAQQDIATPVPADQEKPATVDYTHIKNQKNPFLAEKIDNMLRSFKPQHAMVLVVDAKSNEIIAWGEQKDGQVQNKPDFLIRTTFPAASLAKTVTIAAAMESNRYSLNTPIPLIGRAHHLYKNQLRVPENYKGPTAELQDAYAHSYNPPLGIIGLNVGASRLKAAAKNLGYNMAFPGSLPNKSHYAPPDTGYGLAEVACGFTDATTLSPLQAAAQVRAILMKKPLEIPWATNLDGFAPKSRLALDVGTFSENTYYGLRQAMIRSITHGTARKNISTRHMARKNYNALTIGGKTGSLDGKDPYGRYDWFMGFAQSKDDPNKAIILVVMQVYDPQGIRPQPTTQVSAMVINYWAHQALWGNEKK